MSLAGALGGTSTRIANGSFGALMTSKKASKGSMTRKAG
jgi:hypothetical protein